MQELRDNDFSFLETFLLVVMVLSSVTTALGGLASWILAATAAVVLVMAGALLCFVSVRKEQQANSSTRGSSRGA